MAVSADVSPDRLISRNIRLMQVYRGYYRSIVKALSANDKVLESLVLIIESLSKPERRALIFGRYSTKKLQRFRALLDGWAKANAIELEAMLTAMSVELISEELQQFGELNEKTTNRIAVELSAIAVMGYTLSEIAGNNSNKTRSAALAIIRDGIVNDQDASQIVRALKGTPQLKYRDGVISRRDKSIEGWINTVAKAATTSGQERAWSESGYGYVRIVSVLDSKTSPVCRVRDGEIHPVGSGPRPPFHFNCRTIIIPASGKKPDRIKTYQSWFAERPAWFQREVLGEARYRLYKDGKLPMDRFIDNLGRTLTLDQLRALEAKAWNAAAL